MQWRPSPSAGFSSAPEDALVRPVVSNGPYGYERTSVGCERGDPDSLLNWMASLIRVRKECGEIGAGSWKLVETGCDAAFSIRYDIDGSTVLVVTNLSDARETIVLDLEPADLESVTELLGDRRYEPLDPKKPEMRIEPYGFRWMRLHGVY
jgi:maltose alpha-D-glucosyltransferase / alpha-amylase